MDINELAIKLRTLFSDLAEIVTLESEGNWLPGLEAILDRLPPTKNAAESLELRLQEVKSIFITMSTGQGSFADFFIWVDDFDQRVVANTELEKLKSSIWKLLQDIPALSQN